MLVNQTLDNKVIMNHCPLPFVPWEEDTPPQANVVREDFSREGDLFLALRVLKITKRRTSKGHRKTLEISQREIWREV